MSDVFMGRGSTPGILFPFPFLEDEVEEIYITIFGTTDRAKIEKTLTRGDIAFDEREGVGVISIILSQEDTLMFADGEEIEMQIKAKLTSGIVPYSPIMRTTMGAVLKGEVI